MTRDGPVGPCAWEAEGQLGGPGAEQGSRAQAWSGQTSARGADVGPLAPTWPGDSFALFEAAQRVAVGHRSRRTLMWAAPFSW